MLPTAEVFVSAAHCFDDLVARLPGDRWDGPGLGEWDLRSLVGHAARSLITVSTYLQRPALVVDVASAPGYYAYIEQAGLLTDSAAVTERGRAAGQALGDDPRSAVHALVVDAVDRVSRSDDVLIETIAGGIWLRDYLPTRTFELAVHGLDIAAAVGIDLELPPEVLGASVALAAAVSVEVGSGPVVLAALTGRTALPHGFSIV